MKYFSLLLTFMLFFLISKISVSAEFIALETRTDVTQKFALIKAETKAYASVILIAGGKGKIKLQNNGGDASIYKDGNFLVRTREDFAQQGLNVAVIDAPTDKYDKDGMFYGFRDSDEHMTDLKAVVDYLKQKFNLPVWIIGTSRGTESTANAAITLNKQLQGIVLTSSITEESAKGTSLIDMDLHTIAIPILIVAHNEDACWVTPPEGANAIKTATTKAPVVEIKMFSGGDEPISKPCKAKSPHGFLGIEENVVKYISSFVKKHSH